jgi:hypothetical protein
MSRFKFFGATLVLSALLATPAFAWQAIPEEACFGRGFFPPEGSWLPRYQEESSALERVLNKAMRSVAQN